MKKDLELLCDYLKNGYEDDSKRVEEIMQDIFADISSKTKVKIYNLVRY